MSTVACPHGMSPVACPPWAPAGPRMGHPGGGSPGRAAAVSLWAAGCHGRVRCVVVSGVPHTRHCVLTAPTYDQSTANLFPNPIKKADIQTSPSLKFFH